ncbi:RNA-directed DNA polymerase, eukaryota, reverse transcriptase zinc-binding domain protein [Tanacetum coccineum]
MTFIFESLQPTSEENANSNLSVLLQWSPFSTEEELLKQCESVRHRGTKIIIYNLWLDVEGKMELDFESDLEDIRIMRDGESKTKDKSVKSIPGKFVLYHNIATYLKCHEFISYKSHNNRYVEGELVVTIGFDKNAPNVKPFLSVVGLGKGRGIVGVFEANYIEPAHNKQDFENTNVYQKLVTRLRVMTYEYCCLEYEKVEKELNLKYQSLKSSIKHWLTEDNQKLNENHLIMLDKIIDQGSCNDDLIHERLNLLKEFIIFDSQFPNRLSPDQNEDLERNVSYEEIKRAVWDCGISKYPDGFTFEFYRKYWSLIDHDVVAAFKSWIQGCLNSAMESILVNGSPTLEFKFSKGLKQGDPLSPFLFILIMESLHLSFNNVVNVGLYNCIQIDESLNLSHLFYVDDVIFVDKWNSLNLSTIVNVLKWFYLASGLKINLNKSKLMGIGISHDMVASAAKSIGCSILHTPFNYLGVKLKSLSIGGRLTLIKSVLSSLPLYYMSSFKVPKGVLSKMESIRKNFFNAVENVEKMSLIGWNKILASKKNGGLGVSSFFAYNRALLFKWIWRFLANCVSLWSRFISAIYGIRGALDNYSSYLRRSPWLDIVKEVRKLASKGIDLLSLVKKKVGNGEATSFWNVAWLGDFPLKQTYPRLYFLELDKHVSVASKLRANSLISSFRWSPRSGIEEEQLLLLISNTSSVMLPNISDRWSWLLDSLDDFSVKSTREFIDDSMLPKTDVPTRWVKSIPIKINIFAWRVSLDKLPTRLNLSLRGLDIPYIICPLCSLAVESTSHFPFSYQLARQLMIKVVHWWELEYQDFHSYEDWLLWFKNLRVFKWLKDVFEGVCYISWWVIWKFRNRVLFGINFPRLDLLFDDIVRLSFHWCSSRCSSNFDWNT